MLTLNILAEKFIGTANGVYTAFIQAEEQLKKRRVWLMELCTELGYNYAERLHIIAYGDRRGV